MSLYIRESFVNETQRVQFGESPWIESMYDKTGDLFRSLGREYGRCVSKMYAMIDGVDGIQVGWVFEKRMRYEDARPDYTGRYRADDYYIRHVWVEVSTTDPKPVIEEHPTSPWLAQGASA